jgi:Ni,Fe-hydrogenase III small subunit/formate hydrogenlyase subunit 6/NADH:ubiquinone oxidoreductase subunit I
VLNVLKAAITGGRVTTGYPSRPDAAPVALRGAPTIDPTRCDCSAACVEACPAAAIELTAAGEHGRTWQLDLARCVFCADCVAACPTGALAMSGEYELATRSRSDLLTIVHHGQPSAGTPDVTSHRDGITLPSAEASAPSDLGHQLSVRIRRLLRRSLHIRHMDTGSDNSTDWELNALLNPVYDIQRLGIDVVASPRHADLLFVTGPVTRNLEMALKRTYEAMPAPGIVVAAGAEACGGGIWQGSYAHAGGVDQVLPVDVYIPGDPPRPQAIIHGLLLSLDRVQQKRSRVELDR